MIAAVLLIIVGADQLDHTDGAWAIIGLGLVYAVCALYDAWDV